MFTIDSVSEVVEGIIVYLISIMNISKEVLEVGFVDVVRMIVL